MNAYLAVLSVLLPLADADGDPSDWSGAPWIIIAVLVVAVVVVGGVITARYRSHRER
jgi:hypothetical protein